MQDSGIKIGSGFDVHRLVYGRKLVLGGVEIPFEKGLLGHSDADVLVHAVCDALLGAMGMGDIGLLFPDSDPENKNASSIKFLEKITRLIHKNGFHIINVDATLIAEAPRMALHRAKMEYNIAASLNIDIKSINIKATTTEGLGFTGKGLGIAARCVAMIQKLPVIE
jgi:2-C-methyl-D-erythritol 2,4-cyclodiphosphate synthase